MRIGIIGGGQLCRMMGEEIAKRKLPLELHALDKSRDCPASEYLSGLLVGDFKDSEKIRRLADSSDLLTYEIELACSKALSILASRIPVHPHPSSLYILQDKLRQHDHLAANGLPVPRSLPLHSQEDVERCVIELGLPGMVKSRADSYDGNGNAPVSTRAEAIQAFSRLRKPLMYQEFIDFDKEISVIACRSVSGQTAAYPVTENIHGKEYNILLTSIAPARLSADISAKARDIAQQAVGCLSGAGVFGVEMFVKDEAVLINEIAPRVHNTGHYTIEACENSQFMQHLYLITGNEPLSTRQHSYAIMHNIIGDKSGRYQIMFDGRPVSGTTEALPGLFIHDYQKEEARPWRKLGHMTVLAKNGEKLESLVERAEAYKWMICCDVR